MPVCGMMAARSRLRHAERGSRRAFAPDSPRAGCVHDAGGVPGGGVEPDSPSGTGNADRPAGLSTVYSGRLFSILSAISDRGSDYSGRNRVRPVIGYRSCVIHTKRFGRDVSSKSAKTGRPVCFSKEKSTSLRGFLRRSEVTTVDRTDADAILRSCICACMIRASLVVNHRSDDRYNSIRRPIMLVQIVVQARVFGVQQ